MKDIYSISSVEDLKKEFKIFKEAKENVAKILNKKKVTARSWKILYEKYILPKVQEDMYFKDEISKYILSCRIEWEITNGFFRGVLWSLYWWKKG